ncbi:Jerky protein-like 39, partial [Homarus americanus]
MVLRDGDLGRRSRDDYLIRQARRNMAYARELYAAVSRKMGIAEPKPSNASSGWLHRFKRRNNITNINIGGEEASADRVAARGFPPFLREVMEDGRFTDDQLQKERITVLYTTNASGTCKPKLSVIHTARKPHAYKNVDMSKINVHWLTARM